MAQHALLGALLEHVQKYLLPLLTPTRRDATATFVLAWFCLQLPSIFQHFPDCFTSGAGEVESAKKPSKKALRRMSQGLQIGCGGWI
jgi:hypothetical protein